MEEETLPVGSERYIFKKTWDAECYEGEAPYAFSDELEGYTFWPYSGKLKALPGYTGNEENFEDARIYLMIKEPRKLIKVPCTVWEDMRVVRRILKCNARSVKGQVRWMIIKFDIFSRKRTIWFTTRHVHG